MEGGDLEGGTAPVPIKILICLNKTVSSTPSQSQGETDGRQNFPIDRHATFWGMIFSRSFVWFYSLRHSIFGRQTSDWCPFLKCTQDFS